MTLLPLRVVEAHQAAAELTPGYIVGVGDDPGAADAVLRQRSPNQNNSPSSVTAFASGPSPATENAAAVVSVASRPTTPGTSVASTFRSVASMGNRAIASGLSERSVEPAVGACGRIVRVGPPRIVMSASATGRLFS